MHKRKGQQRVHSSCQVPAVSTAMLPDAVPSSSVTIDMERAAGVLTGDGQTEMTQLSPRRRAVIPMVRGQLRRVAGELFRPHAVSIGPYHQGADSWLWTQEKKRAVSDLGLCGVDLRQVLEDGEESDARRCYPHLQLDETGAPMDSDKFCSMLLHDGCYLLSVFVPRERQRVHPAEPHSHIELESVHTVMRDTLYLLQNQVPLFVIDKILQRSRAGAQETSAIKCIARFVKQFLFVQLYISKTTREPPPETCSHLLDLVYFYLGSTVKRQKMPATVRPCTGRWRRATEYRRHADIRFKRREFGGDGVEWTILDVSLEGGILYIPLLRVDDNTWTLLRNLMALEEGKEARPVTAYCYFLWQMACTAEDVELLRSAKVIEHFLSSDKSAAQRFADLCHGVALNIDSLDRNYLRDIWHAMEDRCDARVHNFKGFFRDKYCSNVFYLVVFFSTIFVFGCQLLQSIYTILAYHKPSNSH